MNNSTIKGVALAPARSQAATALTLIGQGLATLLFFGAAGFVLLVVLP